MIDGSQSLVHSNNSATLFAISARCERSPDGTWGTLRDGAWTGMLGQLIKGEGDVALAPLDRTYPRSQVVSFVFDLSREW